MDTNDLIAFYGSAILTQKNLDISRQLFHYWKANGIPLGWQARIHLATKGKLRASANIKARESLRDEKVASVARVKHSPARGSNGVAGKRTK